MVLTLSRLEQVDRVKVLMLEGRREERRKKPLLLTGRII